jgi:hypothetical protein
MEESISGMRETKMRIKLHSEDLKERSMCNDDNKIRCEAVDWAYLADDSVHKDVLCENCEEIKDGEFLDQVSYYWHLKKNVPWSEITGGLTYLKSD